MQPQELRNMGVGQKQTGTPAARTERLQDLISRRIRQGRAVPCVCVYTRTHYN